MQGPAAPAGTHIIVRLDEPIDTERSRVGQAFQATVQEDIRDGQGTLIVSRGGELTGSVASVGSKSDPKIRLLLETVATVNGPAPLHASILHAQRRTYAGPPSLPTTGDTLCVGTSASKDPFCDSYFYRLDQDGYLDHGFGVAPPVDDRPVEIHLAAGARIELVLTQPLSLPARSRR